MPPPPRLVRARRWALRLTRRSASRRRCTDRPSRLEAASTAWWRPLHPFLKIPIASQLATNGDVRRPCLQRAWNSRHQPGTRDNLNGDTSDKPPAQSTFRQVTAPPAESARGHFQAGDGTLPPARVSSRSTVTAVAQVRCGDVSRVRVGSSRTRFVTTHLLSGLIGRSVLGTDCSDDVLSQRAHPSPTRTSPLRRRRHPAREDGRLGVQGVHLRCPVPEAGQRRVRGRTAERSSPTSSPQGRSQADAERRADDPDFYREAFFVPPEARWEHIRDNLHHQVGDGLNKALAALENAQPRPRRRAPAHRLQPAGRHHHGHRQEVA